MKKFEQEYKRAKGKTVEMGKATFAPPDLANIPVLDQMKIWANICSGRQSPESGAGTASHNDALSELNYFLCSIFQRRRQVRPLRKAWRKPETQMKTSTRNIKRGLKLSATTRTSASFAMNSRQNCSSQNCQIISN